LDVGCGYCARGDINLDYRIGWNPEIEQTRDVHITARNIPNFVLGDALHLPFRDKIFKKVFCYHVIEHVSNPYRLVQELLRVSNGRVGIRCPHRFSKHAKMPYHRQYFTRTWFARALKGHRYKITVTYWCPLRGWLAFIRLPHEIRIGVLLKFPLDINMERIEMLNESSSSRIG